MNLNSNIVIFNSTCTVQHPTPTQFTQGLQINSGCWLVGVRKSHQFPAADLVLPPELLHLLCNFLSVAMKKTFLGTYSSFCHLLLPAFPLFSSFTIPMFGSTFSFFLPAIILLVPQILLGSSQVLLSYLPFFGCILLFWVMFIIPLPLYWHLCTRFLILASQTTGHAKILNSEKYAVPH